LKSYIILSSFLSLLVAFAIIHLKGNSK